jgi:hypothetical protein
MQTSDYGGLVLAALLAGVAIAAEPEDPGDEIVIADRVRTAFYERAPGAVRRKMQRALSVACAAARREPLKDADGRPLDVEPFCNETKFHFWREVIVTGPRLEEGWICADPKGDYDRFRYLTPDMLEDEPCVMATYDYTEERITVDLTLRMDAE